MPRLSFKCFLLRMHLQPSSGVMKGQNGLTQGLYSVVPSLPEKFSHTPPSSSIGPYSGERSREVVNPPGWTRICHNNGVVQEMTATHRYSLAVGLVEQLGLCQPVLCSPAASCGIYLMTHIYCQSKHTRLVGSNVVCLQPLEIFL